MSKKLLGLPAPVGPIIALVSIGLNHLLILLGVFPVQVAWLYLPVFLASFTGLRPGLISAGLVSIYSILLGPTDPQRVLVVPLSLCALAVLAGLQTRELRRSLEQTQAEQDRADENQDKADFVDTLNGNILKLVEVIEVIDEMIDITRLARQDDLTKQLISIRVRLADLTTRAKGWHTLAKSRGFVLGEDG